MRGRAHISDDRLVELCFDARLTAAEDAHVTGCGECRARRSRLELLLAEVSDAARAETDGVFPDERLAAQHARIMQRLEQDGRPARVIAFPASQPSEVRPLRTRPAARWIAGAAAAGLAVGLLAGHLAHDLPQFGRPSRTGVLTTNTARQSPPPALRAVNVSLNDEEFLGEIENAIDGPHLTALRPLNDLTPQ
jgi:hypothetical protein